MAFAQLTYRESLRDIETCAYYCLSLSFRCHVRVSVTRAESGKVNWQ